MASSFEVSAQTTLENGFIVAVAGRSANEIPKLEREELWQIGTTVISVLPSHNVVALFESLPGMSDVRTSAESAIIAAHAVRNHYEKTKRPKIDSAMQAARRAVSGATAGSLCVGTIVQVETPSKKPHIRVINAGDTSVMAYDRTDRSKGSDGMLTYITTPQTEPYTFLLTNYLGQPNEHIPITTQDNVGDYELGSLNTVICMASRKLFSKIGFDPSPEAWQFAAAYDDYPLFTDAVRANALPERKSTGNFDWKVWEWIVPQLAKKGLTRKQITPSTIAMGLVQPPIYWRPQHSPSRGDASLIMLAHPDYTPHAGSDAY